MFFTASNQALLAQSIFRSGIPNYHVSLSPTLTVFDLTLQERKGAKTVRDIKQFVSKLPHIQAAKQSLATRKYSLVKVTLIFLLKKSMGNNHI